MIIRSMFLAEEAPNPILPEANEVIWGGVPGVLVLALMVVVIWALVHHVRRTRSIAEEALRQAAQHHSETEVGRR